MFHGAFSPLRHAKAEASEICCTCKRKETAHFAGQTARPYNDMLIDYRFGRSFKRQFAAVLSKMPWHDYSEVSSGSCHLVDLHRAPLLICDLLPSVLQSIVDGKLCLLSACARMSMVSFRDLCKRPNKDDDVTVSASAITTIPLVSPYPHAETWIPEQRYEPRHYVHLLKLPVLGMPRRPR